MRKYKLIFIIIIVGILMGLIFSFLQPQSPLNALENEYMDKEPNLRYTGLINQIDINSEKSLLFYYNGNGNVNCAICEKKLGFYKVIHVLSELSSHNKELRVGLLGGTYKDRMQYKWVYFGIIYDNSVKKVIWNNTEAIKISMPEFNMIYAVGDDQFMGDDYNIYDSNGNKLNHLRLHRNILAE